MTSLIDCFNAYKDNSPEQRKRAVAWHIQSQMQVRYREWRFAHISRHYPEGLKAKFALYKEFSEKFSQCIKDEDDYEALSLINNHHFRAVRDRVNGEFAEIMDHHFSGTYGVCHDCGEVEHDDNMSWAYDDYKICGSCCNSEYHWSDYRDCYVRDDDEEDEDSCGGLIGEYHSTDIGHISTSFDNRATPIYLGMELEVEMSSGDRESKAQEITNAIKYHNGEEYCGLENDGSLDNGFEIITGYTGLDTHAKALEFFKKPWNGVKSHDTDTCGLHVHICKKGMTMFHAAKMIFFINDEANERLINAVARRDSSEYAKFKDKKGSLDWVRNAKNSRNPMNNLNQDRYEALNFQNPNTVEFRLFKGTLKYTTIMACLEFTYATWFFSREYGTTELTTDNFLKFICRAQNKCDTVHLRNYLSGKGFKLPKAGLVKINPRYSEVDQLAVAA